MIFQAAGHTNPTDAAMTIDLAVPRCEILDFQEFPGKF